jgi:hypothetical protein
MSYIAATDDGHLASVTVDFDRLVSIAKKTGQAVVKYGFYAALCVLTTSGTAWLVGITMNYAFVG